jgi:hypothetical protein
MIDFDTPILDLNDDPVMENGQEVTLEKVCITALMMQAQNENPPPSGEEKFQRYLLATKCKGQVALKAEEIATLKRLIGVICPPLVVGRCWQLLDQAEIIPLKKALQ